MADNLKYNEPGSGPQVATDLIESGGASGHYQWFKLDVGPPNESIPVTGSTFGVPVDVKRIVGITPVSGTVTIGSALPAGSNEIGIVRVSAVSGVVSTVNSTTSTLGANGIFTGTAEEVLVWSEVQINLIASASGATSGMAIQHSSDGSNWDLVELYTIKANVPYSIRFAPKATYFRINYQNGATAQSSFRLQTIFKGIPTAENITLNERITVNGISYRVLQRGINATLSGDNIVIPSGGTKIYRIISIVFTCSSNVDVIFKSGASNTLISAMPFAKYGGLAVNFGPCGFFCETNAGEAFIMNLSSALNVRGSVNYIEL